MSEMTADEYLADNPQPGKYRNVKTVVDGQTFDSKAEANRYGELKHMLDSGEIGELVLQPWFDLCVNGVKICRYVGDFEYFIGERHVIEDVKGMKTPTYRMKRKLMKAIHGIDVVEVES